VLDTLTWGIVCLIGGIVVGSVATIARRKLRHWLWMRDPRRARLTHYVRSRVVHRPGEADLTAVERTMRHMVAAGELEVHPDDYDKDLRDARVRLRPSR
jgi:hypothetical protein